MQALALQAGQVLDGRVLGPAPNGGTQVQIEGKLLNLVLPQAAKAGDTLRFEVQGSGAQVRLALQVAAGKQALPAPIANAPTPASAQPAGPAPASAIAQPPAGALQTAASSHSPRQPTRCRHGICANRRTGWHLGATISAGHHPSGTRS